MDKINYHKTVIIVLPVIILLEITRIFYSAPSLYFFSRILLIYFIILSLLEFKLFKELKYFILLIFLFSSWSLLTALWSYDPQITYPRAFYFAYVAAASTIGGYLWYKFFSNSVLSFLLSANILIVIISFISLITNKPENSWTGGCGIGFMGYAPHQNILGMMILFTIPPVLFRTFAYFSKNFFNYFSHSNKKNYVIMPPILFFILLTSNVYLIILSHSRASVLSLLLIIVTFVLFSFKWKIFLTSSLILIIFISALFFVIPDFGNKAINYALKTEKNIGERRYSQLEATIAAAKNGGIIGLGYGISDPKNILPKDNPSEKRYYREKMISILALVEEVGIIGLILFLTLIGYVYARLLSLISMDLHSNDEIKVAAKFIFTVLLGLSLNAQIEGWWLGPGSWQFLLFFTIIGSSLGIINRAQSLKIQF